MENTKQGKRVRVEASLFLTVVQFHPAKKQDVDPQIFNLPFVFLTVSLYSHAQFGR